MGTGFQAGDGRHARGPVVGADRPADGGGLCGAGLRPGCDGGVQAAHRGEGDVLPGQVRGGGGCRRFAFGDGVEGVPCPELGGAEEDDAGKSDS